MKSTISTHQNGSGGNKNVGREGFEPSKAEPADLQSDPVDRLGTYPFLLTAA